MSEDSTPPILDHPTEQPSAFTAKDLIEDLRRTRYVPAGAVPPVCILEFDGDLTDWLVQEGIAKLFASWACFHTSMFAMEIEGIECGIIARTIGGPYAVLIAEQLQSAGAKIIIGLTSAGRLASSLPLPCLVVATSAIRDEGTSYHYLPPARDVACPTQITSYLQRELQAATGWTTRSGAVWTTDAPFRETPGQLEKWAGEGALAVEMQAASLFAFGIARQASVACVAMVSNAIDHQGEQFDTGSQDDGLKVLQGIARAARSYLEQK
ncbi:MAG: nucleoside phosphorylase [Bryobacterales bacterium]